MNKPNIMLIMADQQRVDTIGCLGRTGCRTANLNRLADGGIVFDRCVTTSPLCGPARCSIFTGLYPHQGRGVMEKPSIDLPEYEGQEGKPADMMSNGTSLRNEPALTSLLRERGYHTAYAGKWHLGDDVLGRWFDRYGGSSTPEYSQWCEDNGLPDGWAFNDMRVRSERPPHMSIPLPMVSPVDAAHSSDAWTVDYAMRCLEERPKDKPFFLTCAFNGPHPPFKIPEPYFSMYDAESIPEPANFGIWPGEPASNENSYFRALWRDHGDHWQKWQKSVAVYWGFVTMLDDQVGRLLGCLEKQNALEDTLVIYCGDHGEMMGQHGLWHKSHAYEEALRVPLIMSAPWISNTGTCSAGASVIDIPATILSAAGIEQPAEYEGVDLTGAFNGTSGLVERDFLFAEMKPLGKWHGIVDWRMVTDNAYKYTWNRDDVDEFYDLAADPYEKNNLIGGEHALAARKHATRLAGSDETDNLIRQEAIGAEVKRFREALANWMRRTSDPLLGSV